MNNFLPCVKNDQVDGNKDCCQVTGVVERIAFHNTDSGFCVIRVKVKGERELVTVVGNSHTILVGEHIETIGRWVKDKEHGLQLKADIIKTAAPTSLEGIERYLASGLIKGIGSVYAKKLIQAFGTDVFTVIEKEDIKLRTVPGIGPSRAAKIKESWDSQRVIREIILFLYSYNISTSKATKIYKQYGTDAIAIIKQNPYRLAADIKGIGFKSADNIAESVGIAKNSMIRARAGVSYALATIMDNGNCGLSTNKLINLCRELLDISEELIITALQLEIDEGNVIKEVIEDEECIFLKSLAHAERQIAESIVHISRGKLSWPQIDSDKVINFIVDGSDLKLSSSQQQAIKWALCSKFMIITGGPGVGKTTLINSLLKIFKAEGVKILLAAPTGRAAKRLKEATNHQAFTIHRLLKKNLDQDIHTNVILQCQLLILDEASMIDVPLMHAVLKALPENAALFLVGDVDQLPSVGPGQVFSDLINSKCLTVVPLTEIFRQNQESSINY